MRDKIFHLILNLYKYKSFLKLNLVYDYVLVILSELGNRLWLSIVNRICFVLKKYRLKVVYNMIIKERIINFFNKIIFSD